MLSWRQSQIEQQIGVLSSRPGQKQGQQTPKHTIHTQQPNGLNCLLFTEEEKGSEKGEDLSKVTQQVSNSTGHSDSLFRSHLVAVRDYEKSRDKMRSYWP